ncbi:MAG: hypothetical protein M3239_04395 [Thermoproteota archaeon]|nr:hypothetical protein [Thermoproteota archaeon]
MLSHILPDGQHARACSDSAALYLSSIGWQISYYLSVKLPRVEALGA